MAKTSKRSPPFDRRANVEEKPAEIFYSNVSSNTAQHQKSLKRNIVPSLLVAKKCRGVHCFNGKAKKD
jgi:hypothetical protein